jgi:biopolymer transport protein TolR
MFARKKKKSDQHAEVNLIPFIDLLSVCISFLLLTAVWLQTGVMSTKQGLGTESQVKAEDIKSLWVSLEAKDSVVVATKGFKQNSKRRLSLKELTAYARNLRKKNPDLRTALVLPELSSNYDDLVGAMNSLRKAEISDIGISPL